MLDQHYMIDSSLIKRIAIYADLKKTDKVVEIGAGTGNLTKTLKNKCDLNVIEIEKSQEKALKTITDNVIIGNALELLPGLKFNKIVANIPYSISEPLTRIILIKRPELVVITTGKRFSELLQDKDNKIHLLIDALYDIEIKEIIEPFAFQPKPKTKSAAVVLRLRNKKNNTQELLSQLIYLHHKKIKNALMKILIDKGSTKNQAREMISRYDDKFLEKGLFSLSNKDMKRLSDILNSL